MNLQFGRSILPIALSLTLAACANPFAANMHPEKKAMAETVHPQGMNHPMQHGENTGLGAADAQYDLRFLNKMIAHHQEAIALAQDAVNKAQNPEVKQFAQRMIPAHQQEIAQMTKWRQTEVAARGPNVMPFDLTQTLHDFQSVKEGGILTVTANDPKNEIQIQLIREHLQKEFQKFTQGNFSDPASLHGENMPGLSAMATGIKRIKINYAALLNGARLTFVTSDPALVNAIHQWFAAQRMDHHHHGAK
jgi:predicted outer membrane protein